MRSFISKPYEYIAGFRDVVQQQSLSADVTCYWVFGMQADVKPVLDSILKLNKISDNVTFSPHMNQASYLQFIEQRKN